MAKPEPPEPASPHSTVRISKENLDAVNALAKELGMAAANIVDLCIADCIAALKRGRPITPRVVKLRRILKKPQ